MTATSAASPTIIQQGHRHQETDALTGGPVRLMGAIGRVGGCGIVGKLVGHEVFSFCNRGADAR